MDKIYTNNGKDQHKKNLAVIHILKKDYNLSDETYRSILDEEFNVISSADLDLEEQEKFIHILNFRFSESYKRGYTKAIKDFIDNASNLETLFLQLKEPTEFEIKLFRMLSVLQKRELIQELMTK